MKNRSPSVTPEQIQDEQFTLLDFQANQHLALELSGTLRKAEALADTGEFTEQTRASVARGYAVEDTDERVELLSIRFVTPGLSRSGHNTRTFKYVPVAAISEESIELKHDFTLDEATLVKNMIAGLCEAKEMGILPHLAPDLENIFNPYTAISKLPSVK